MDRLTRFKYSKEKYLRVFTDIILNNMIEPKLKKNELLNLPFSEIKNIAVEIFNSSLDVINDFYINKKIYDYENSVFNLEDEIKELVNNQLYYKSALK